MTQQPQRMQTLVGDLLTLAQLEGSPRPPADRWVARRAAVRAGRGRGARAVGRPPRDRRSPAATARRSPAPRRELLSAIGNLVSNAVRYTPERRHDRRRAGACAPTARGEFEVRDTGPGIAREHLPRLTERFYRVDGSRSRETGGTGLGLAIVKHVVQRHGGELDIDSEPGKGSTLPAGLPGRARARAPSRRRPRRRRGDAIDAP